MCIYALLEVGFGLADEGLVHGSRFDGLTGKCVMGPANRGLTAENDAGEEAQSGTSG